MVRITGVGGRQEEVLYFPARLGHGATDSVAVHPMIFYRILDAAPLTGWQVVQEANRLSLRLSRSGEGSDQALAEALVQAVRQAIERQGGEAPPISVDWLDGVGRGATGKARHIVRAQADGGGGSTALPPPSG
jgi:hypothetical protein